MGIISIGATVKQRVYIIHDYGDTCMIAAGGVVYLVPTTLLQFENTLWAFIDPDELTDERLAHESET